MNICSIVCASPPTLIRLILTLILYLPAVNSSGQTTGGFKPPSREEIITSELMNTISSWADAWQSQLPDQYIAHYSRDYQPVDYPTREAWIESRRSRLLEPEYIKLQLLEFRIQELTEKRAVTHFKLVYERPDYADVTDKELVFSIVNGLWLITEENNLEVKAL